MAAFRRLTYLGRAATPMPSESRTVDSIIDKPLGIPPFNPSEICSKLSQAHKLAKVTNCDTRERIHFLSSFKERGEARWHRRALLHRLVAAKRRSTAAGSSKSATANVNQRRTSWSAASASVAKWITGQGR